MKHKTKKDGTKFLIDDKNKTFRVMMWGVNSDYHIEELTKKGYTLKGEQSPKSHFHCTSEYILDGFGDENKTAIEMRSSDNGSWTLVYKNKSGDMWEEKH